MTTPLRTTIAHLEAQNCAALDNGYGPGEFLRPAWSSALAPQK